MPRYLFITGRLAEHALRSVVETLAPAAGFDAQIAVLPITVAALLQVDWILKKLTLPAGIDRVILPGWSLGDTRLLERHFGVPFERGPKNLYDLPEHFGRARRPQPDLSRYDIEIIAEINHVPRLSDVQILETAEGYRRDGADIIDLGCIPGEPWTRVREVVTMLRREGFRLSIDSFERSEMDAAVEAGAELVLSCNSSNIDWATGLGVELVAIPDDPHRLDTLEPVIERLTAVGARFRIDPILEPIGFGFAASLARYSEARRRWPDLPIMMGIGNVTELSEADTGGMNLLLAGFCQELGIRSVLATQVINWARTAVKEFDLARRLVCHAVNERVLPKHLSSQLVLLRDARIREMGPEEMQRLAESIRDPNFRLFVERGEIHVLNRDGYWHGRDAYELFDRFTADSPGLDASHAFYLGYELSKAVTALTLGKQYTQDEALQWGFLTLPEASAHARRKNES